MKRDTSNPRSAASIVLAIFAATWLSWLPASPAEDTPLSAAETKLQGDWVGGYGLEGKDTSWTMKFEGRRFHAEGSANQWYVGEIVVRPEEDPPHLDFIIHDCSCKYKDKTSTGIYEWKDKSLVFSGPAPGDPRPTSMDQEPGQIMRFVRSADE